MPQPLIRMPKEGRALLKFVKASREGDPEHAIFEFYVDLFMAGMALGFASDTARENPEFLTGDPGPIEYAVFKNQGYHDALALVAICHTGDATVADHPEQIAVIAEKFAAAGLQRMADRLDDTGHPSLWIQSWQDALVQEPTPSA